MRHGVRRAAKVRVFIDFWNFALKWKTATKLFPQENLDWARLPDAILGGLDAIPHMRNTPKELRGVKVYASTVPTDYYDDPAISSWKAEDRKRLEKWLSYDLDQKTSYTVDITLQSERAIHCPNCHEDTSYYTEQGVDTKIAIDLVSFASRDLYDIAVLVTDDHDLVPATQCVQEAIDKQVIHLGFRRKKDEKKSPVQLEAWGHLFIDDMMSTIRKNVR